MPAESQRSSILRKLRALRAKTPTNGCTEAEALAAADLVAKLLLEYDLTEADVAEAASDDNRVLRESFDTPRGAADAIGQVICRFCEVSVIFNHSRREVFGTRPAIELYTWFNATLESAFARAWTEYSLAAPDDPRPNLHLNRESFLVGIARRVGARLEALIAERLAHRPVGRALVLDPHAAAKAARDLAFPHQKSHNSGGRALDPLAYAAGQAAGDRVGLGRPLDERRGPVALPAPRR